jgi:hypothetical protein
MTFPPISCTNKGDRLKNARVNAQGACAGTVLVGTGLSNKGLRIRITKDQERGMQGPIQGEFVILDAGDNARSDALRPLVNRLTDAAEVARVIRADHPACVNVVNAHALVPEHSEPEAVGATAGTASSSLPARARNESASCPTIARVLRLRETLMPAWSGAGSESHAVGSRHARSGWWPENP